MREIEESKSTEALKSMGNLIEDLGLCPLPDSDIDARFVLKHTFVQFFLTNEIFLKSKYGKMNSVGH